MSYMMDQGNISSAVDEQQQQRQRKRRQHQGRTLENVLIMQGGGSLGAFACGVYKALVRKKVKIDIAAGTSIGAVNAAIIVGSKNDHPEKDLEDFWIEIAESNHHIIPDLYIADYDNYAKEYTTNKISAASANAAVFGVPKMFIPRWGPWIAGNYLNREGTSRESGGGCNASRSTFFSYPYFDPRSWTYLYDHSPLEKTLNKYIDYKKLNLAGTKEKSPEVLRLIITAVDVLTARPLIFDNTRMEIKAKHILASSGYPIYGFPWIKIDDDDESNAKNNSDNNNNADGIYAWDGSLLSNTPVREVLNMSPRNDKNIFIVENYPRKVRRLPSNMAEVQSRAKDILFCDKNMETIRMSRLITRQIQLIKRLYNIFETDKLIDRSKINANEVREIESEYNKLIENYGAQILSVVRIVRSETELPTILQNADFSPGTVKELILQGEQKTIEELAITKGKIL
ncbi:MAG: patatin-like phospholipase family protein [Nitrososphaeraceae archaeon]